MENLHDRRKVYEKLELLDNEVKSNPMEQFRLWYAEAEEKLSFAEANAMAVATVDDDGCPISRVLLLKAFTREGFVFYTNYLSKKAKSLDKTNCVGLSFFWEGLERQVVIKARTERVSEKESDEYFASRPRGSQLGAWASPQSQEIPNRAFLAERLSELEKEFEGKDVPRPEHWGGYIARPYEIEFWQGRPNRLHDRIIYQLQEDNTWKISRLAP